MRYWTTVLSASLCLAACGSSNPTDGGTSQDGTANNPDGGSQADATNPGTDGGETNGGTTGFISITQSSVNAAGMSFNSNSISAAFLNTVTSGTGNVCNVTNMGSCQISICQAADGGGLMITTTPESAGNLTISGGQFAMDQVLMPDASGRYMGKSSQTLAFKGGDMLHFVGAGAAVPAFDQMLAAPTRISVSTPSLMGGMPLQVNRQSDFPVMWTATDNSAGTVVVSLVKGGGNAAGVEVSCTFMASDGMGSVPAAVMSMFSAGTGSISIVSVASTMVTAGAYQVKLSATAFGAAGMAIFQ
jgi:hypothetical protein